jgi:S1-C subfamily serine protease
VRRAALAAAAALLVPAAGCDLNGDDSTTGDAAAPRKVTTTRVQVVEGLGRNGGFDPAAIYDRLSPGVVTILSLFRGGTSLLEDEGEGGQGSGFVIDGEGYIATNAHVVTTQQGEKTEQADDVFVEFSDGNRVAARVVGNDPFADVALLKVDPSGLSLTPLRLGDSAQIKSQSGGGEGVGFAVPVDTVRRSLRELREKGQVDYGYLGVETLTIWPQLADRLDLGADTGALVQEVVDGSPAEDAGIEAGGDEISFQGQSRIATGGDLIVGVNGKELTREHDLADEIGLHSAGERVTLAVLRDGERRAIQVELGKRPARAGP